MNPIVISVLSKMLFISGIITLIMPLTDLFIDKSAQEKISMRIIAVWSWIEDTRRVNFSKLLKDNKIKIISILIGDVIVGSFYFVTFYSIFFDSESGEMQFLVLIVYGVAFYTTICMVIGSVAAYFALKLIANFEKTLRIFIAASIMFGLLCAVNYFMTGLVIKYYDVHLQGWLDLIIIIPEIILGALLQISFLIFIVVILPLMLINVISFLFFGLEFVLRKIAEYPKGPV